MQKKRSGIKVLGLLSAMLLVAVLAGCSSKPVSPGDISIPLPPATNQVGAYNDIQLPVEMKYDKTQMAIRNENFSGGVFNYEGKVDVPSLKDFIVSSMRNNKWRFDGENTSPKKIILAFTKPNKTCMMIIDDKFMTTQLELIVTENLTVGKSLDPFGQPIN